MKKLSIKHKKAFAKSNAVSAAKSVLRVEKAYKEWLVDKNLIKKLAIKHKTNPTKLTAYILSKGHRLTSFNIHVFDVIDTEEKAYWLGFLLADGAVSSRDSNLELSLQLSDVKHLEKFKLFLDSSNQVRTDSFRCRFTAGNKHFKANLVKLGCTPKKSFTLRFPKLQKSLQRHFVRGYFDGDGCISRNGKNKLWNTASISCGNPEFLKSLLKVIKKETGMITKQQITGTIQSEVKNLTFAVHNFIKLVNWMYHDCNIYLDRKYNRFLNSIAVLPRDWENYKRVKTVKGVIPNTVLSRSTKKLLTV